MKRKFFVCSVGQPGKGYDLENLKRIIENNAFILHEDTKQKGTYSEIRPNDVLLLKYQNTLIAYGIAKGNYQAEHNEWNLFSPVQTWVFHDESNKEKGISCYGLQWDTISGGQFGTVKEVKPKFGIVKMEEINSDSNLFKEIKNEVMDYIKSENLEKMVSLLSFKKQIILQGPPGTGKTFLAKKLAKALTSPRDLGSPLQKIDAFFKTFNAKKQEYLALRQEKEKLLQEFQNLFPKKNLKDLSLKSYCIGTGERDNFCWWIERGLKGLGYYFPGSSRSYLIYWSQKDQAYKTHYRSLKAFKNIESAEEGMKIIADLIFSLVNHTDKVHLEDLPFGWSFILKILHSYNPDTFFPANGQNYMSNILNLVGLENSSKSPLEKNLMLQEYFEKKKSQFGADVKNFEFMIWLDNEFDLKGDKINLNDQKLISEGESKLIQFHPAYTYEDFVRGIVIEANDGNQPEYKVVDKVLSDFARKALENKSSNYVLIIDEINRANLPSVLGELIYALEYRFDPERPEDTSVESMYSLRDDGDSEATEGRILRLPNNLLIIGTMNTADRSVGHIDYAIRRRFAFVDVLPSINPISNALAKEMFERVSKLFVSNYEEIVTTQATPKRADTLMPDFRPEDVWIGHSYFLTDDKVKQEPNDQIKIKMKYEVLPLLKEYVKDGILRSDENKSDDPVQQVIQELNGL